MMVDGETCGECPEGVKACALQNFNHDTQIGQRVNIPVNARRDKP